MESERLRITLDNPEKTYFAGQNIKGEIWMNLARRVKIRAIKIQLTGKGKCKWMEIMRKESMNESARSLFYSSKEIYVHDDHPLNFFEPRGVELGVGEHNFEFVVPLATNLPSSFKGNYGSIKYKLRIVIQKPWMFAEKHIIPLNIVKHIVVPPSQRMNPTTLTKQITKTISLFGNRPITLVAVLPEDFALRSEQMKLLVTVANNSNMNVEKLKFSILQLVTYYSHVPLRINKTECFVIFQKETGSVSKKSERTFAHELPIPACQPTDDELSGVINISYEMRVEAVLRGFFKNLLLELPFKVFTSDADVVMSQCAPPPSQPPPSYAADNSAGNPFESTYPPLDTSLTSIGSPSHSSQYSESSSIDSTTSDSSAATLSPAVGAGLSYASGTSSQFNSPSARSSMRSSGVPYMSYTSSPMMVNSYPPPHNPPYPLTDSPQYALMPQPSPPAMMSASSCLPSTSYLSRVSFLQPPGVSDLPPTYDELFGDASAPPDTPK